MKIKELSFEYSYTTKVGENFIKASYRETAELIEGDSKESVRDQLRDDVVDYVHETINKIVGELE